MIHRGKTTKITNVQNINLQACIEHQLISKQLFLHPFAQQEISSDPQNILSHNVTLTKFPLHHQ